MDAIPLAAYRRRRSRTSRVREVPPAGRIGRAAVRAELSAGERVLADLSLAWNEPVLTGRVLARFAAVRVLSGGPDGREARRLLAEWEPCVRGTAEGRALTRALSAAEPAPRGRALHRAALEAERLGHHASALTLYGLAWESARSGRRRNAACAAAHAAARTAQLAGARRLGRLWARRARRLGRGKQG